VRIALHLPGRPAAEVERLLAPGLDATSGVTLAGRTLTSQGRWRGRLAGQVVLPRSGGYEVPLPAFSAALITVPS
jgi:hypothetical protein